MIGYLDLPSGLSGDMFLGCLIDAGWPIQRLEAVIGRLDLASDRWTIKARSVMKGPLHATSVQVETAESHHHRRLEDVCRIIAAGSLPQAVQQRATAVFRRLAEAEAKVHGTHPDRISFHEVGALDAIIDIVGVISGLDELSIDALYAAPPPLGRGWTDSAHGPLPLPAPATLQLLAQVGAPTRPARTEGEWLTPTGASLLAELARFEQPVMHLDRIGTGAGQRDCPWPNVARLWTGRPEATGPMVQMETNIDDMNPQHFADITERLLAAGARDAWLTPVQMKKDRPGVLLSVLGLAQDEPVLAELILRHTTTLGLRVFAVHRHEAQREIRRISTPYGPLDVKFKFVGGDYLGAMPEFDQCRQLARQAGVPLRQVVDQALVAAGRQMESTKAEPSKPDEKTQGA